MSTFSSIRYSVGARQPKRGEGTRLRPATCSSLKLRSCWFKSGGPQPPAGGQVAGLLLRDPDLNPCQSRPRIQHSALTALHEELDVLWRQRRTIQLRPKTPPTPRAPASPYHTTRSPRARPPSRPFRNIDARPAAVCPPPSPSVRCITLSGLSRSAPSPYLGAMALQRAVCRPRDAEHTVLHQVIAEYLEVFLRAVAEAGDGAGLPQFVEPEFQEFLLCGVFEAGVARFRCEGCAREHLVPFSCKGRAWSPSCRPDDGARRPPGGRGAAVGAGDSGS